MSSRKTSKFVKVFSLKSFLLYGMLELWCNNVCLPHIAFYVGCCTVHGSQLILSACKRGLEQKLHDIGYVLQFDTARIYWGYP